MSPAEAISPTTLGTFEATCELASVGLLFVLLTVAATTDVVSRRVPNWLTYPAIFLGLALGYGAGGWGEGILGPGLQGRLAALAFAGGIFLVAWWARAVGGGEVKLAAALGGLVGFPFVIPAVFWSSVLGAAFAVWAMLVHGRFRVEARRALRSLMRLGAEPGALEDPTTLKIPYAVPMAFGTVLAWFLEMPPA